MSNKIDDFDNPEWTEADFARAKPASTLPGGMLAAFPKTMKQSDGNKGDEGAVRGVSVRDAIMAQHKGARQTALAA